MKKISLMSLNLDSQEKLTREQLKNVFGGNIASTDPGGEGKKQQCCWTSGSKKGVCNDCVTVPNGSHLECETGSEVKSC